jgi:hypothetical protein
MYRCEQNETYFSDAERLAWEFVLPWKYIPILDTDRSKTAELAKFLSKSFSRQALKSAASKLPKVPVCPPTEDNY